MRRRKPRGHSWRTGPILRPGQLLLKLLCNYIGIRAEHRPSEVKTHHYFKFVTHAIVRFSSARTERSGWATSSIAKHGTLYYYSQQATLIILLAARTANCHGGATDGAMLSSFQADR